MGHVSRASCPSWRSKLKILTRCSSSFFSGCHYFIPVFDPSYDEFESFVQRTPFSFDGMLAVAAKIRAGAG